MFAPDPRSTTVARGQHRRAPGRSRAAIHRTHRPRVAGPEPAGDVARARVLAVDGVTRAITRAGDLAPPRATAEILARVHAAARDGARRRPIAVDLVAGVGARAGDVAAPAGRTRDAVPTVDRTGVGGRVTRGAGGRAAVAAGTTDHAEPGRARSTSRAIGLGGARVLGAPFVDRARCEECREEDEGASRHHGRPPNMRVRPTPCVWRVGTTATLLRALRRSRQ